jgi:two-component system nitrate/nitrite response regulator NarL
MFYMGNGTNCMRILIAEGLEPVRSRLTALVSEQPDVRVVGDNADLEATLAGIRREKPDVVILGSRLSDGTGFQVLRNLTGEMRDMSVILLCHQLDGEYLYCGHALGADFVLEAPRDIHLVPSLLTKFQEDRRRRKGLN